MNCYWRSCVSAALAQKNPVAERQLALAQAAEQLAGNADQVLADILYKVLQGIDKNHLFSVGGEPVLIDWYGPSSAVSPVSYVAADHAAMAMAAGAAVRAQVAEKKAAALADTRRRVNRADLSGAAVCVSQKWRMTVR